MEIGYKKVGIFGGTFDPIHIGHLMLAEAAYEKFSLDKVFLMPTPAPYHRNDKKVQDLSHRINMVKAAVSGNDHLEFSDFEINIPGPTYTVNTLIEFNKAYPDCEIYLIVGGDSLFSMERWYKPEEIFRLATVVSSKREGENKGASGSLKASSEINAEQIGSADPLHDEFLMQIEHLKEKFGARIYDIDMPNIEISSSAISKRIREGRSVKYYLPDPVIDYITDNNLYRGQ